MTRALAILLFTATIAFGLAPFATPDFGGFEADQFPIPQENPPVQPAGYAFSIWGPIYLWLLGSAAFQLFARHDDPAWAPLRLPLLISVAVGAIWLVIALQSPLWATALIWVMWAGAVLALLRAPRFDTWWGEGPIGLYAGWLTAASCVALGLIASGYGLLPQVLSAALALLLALAIAVWVLHARPQSWSFAAAFIWALLGVVVRNWGGEPFVAGLAIAGTALILGVLFLQRPSKLLAETDSRL